eukprot:scaffold1704_cov246-Pinguiococcus_pyrenoidosus.AAC.3
MTASTRSPVSSENCSPPSLATASHVIAPNASYHRASDRTGLALQHQRLEPASCQGSGRGWPVREIE